MSKMPAPIKMPDPIKIASSHTGKSRDSEEKQKEATLVEKIAGCSCCLGCLVIIAVVIIFLLALLGSKS